MSQTQTDRPNILWITTHDINPHLSCYRGVYPGAEYFSTPHLDKLANEGVRFDRAFATAPVCSPSRSSIITGRYPTSIGTMHHRTKAVPPPEVKLLPEYFRAAGYYTTVNMMLDAQLAAPAPAFDDVLPTAHWRGRPSAGTPFFSAIHLHTTHESQIYLDDDAFARATPDVAEAERHDPEYAPLPPYYPDTEVFRKSWARYADLISQMDVQVGRILQQLEEDGLAQSTIVVFWSDHGLGMPRGKRWLNDSGLHEPLIIRWPGRIRAGSVRSDLISLMDLAPTMLEVAGLSIPEHMEGKSILRRGGDFISEPNDYVFASRDRMDEQEDTSRSARNDRFRYIRHFHPDRSAMQHCQYPDELGTWKEFRRLHFAESEELARGEQPGILSTLQRSLVAATRPQEELYDLDADPYEERNLAEAGEYQQVRHEMASVLDRWISSTKDLGLRPEEELLRHWRPDGQARITAQPETSISETLVTLECETPGSTIGWTFDPPQDAAPTPPHFTMMGIEVDGRRWKLYSSPFDLPSGSVVYAKAWRMGYVPSAEVVIRIGDA